MSAPAITPTLRVMLQAVWAELVLLRLDYLASRLGERLDGYGSEDLGALLAECRVVGVALEAYTSTMRGMRGKYDNEGARKLLAAIEGARALEALRLERESQAMIAELAAEHGVN